MTLFHHNRLSFAPIDQLGGGLREEIESEQESEDVIVLDDRMSEDGSCALWDNIDVDEEDLEQVTFTED